MKTIQLEYRFASLGESAEVGELGLLHEGEHVQQVDEQVRRDQDDVSDADHEQSRREFLVSAPNPRPRPTAAATVNRSKLTLTRHNVALFY